MSAEKTLLAHLVPKMDRRTEDIAVEALRYILFGAPAEIQRELAMPVGADYIPLFLPIGVEYEMVVSMLISRLEEIGRAINPEFELARG